MKCKQALQILTNYKPGCFGVLFATAGENASVYFPGLCDSVDFERSGTYFYVWATTFQADGILRAICRLTHAHYADYELPTHTGVYFLFELEDYNN